MSTAHAFDCTPDEASDISVLLLCRDVLPAEQQIALDARLAAHAARIHEDQDIPLPRAVAQAAAQFGAELRSALQERLS